ncbi:MAG: hypothetical protein A3J97_09970 [Spirochaetes bacterium RIFOXYC1_FULL_54_7]|nr:MAG: hypothetical protein A3J97_09970 [Spirochaetes bacterium RIFOXYC1_FULL_54_7]
MSDSILQSLLTQAQKHASVLIEDLSELQPMRPFSAGNLVSASSGTLRILDQFNVRFTKLQDVLGSKVFPRILNLLGEDVRSLAFIDVLSRLEALGFIDSADTWLSLREQRNRLSHDYPDDPDILAAELNSALEATTVLLEYWLQVKDRISNNQHL